MDDIPIPENKQYPFEEKSKEKLTRIKAMAQNEDIQDLEAEVVLKIPTIMDIREELSFYRHIREVFKTYGKDTDHIDFVISNMEKQVEIFKNTSPTLPDMHKMEEAILRHPYFKNPCDYPIRLITILKYLKRKGFNMNYTDIDLYVDKVLQKVDGIKKVGRGLYRLK